MILISAPDISGRLAEARATALIYSKQLGLLSFKTAIVGGIGRPEFDRRVREASAAIPQGAEVALIVVGTAASSGRELFVVPSDAVGNLDTQAAAAETEALRLSSIQRRLLDRSPREFVSLIEDCRENGERCSASALDSEPRGSAVAMIRNGLTSRSTAREAELSALIQPGLNYEQFFSVLSQKIGALQGVVIRATSLSSTFRFVPSDFFDLLPSECFQIDPLADPMTALNPGLAAKIEACERAASDWPSVWQYHLRLKAGKEQLAYQRAVASCDRPTAASSYAAAYPDGRYAGTVEQFRQSCLNRPRPTAAPPVAPPEAPVVRQTRPVEASELEPPVRVTPSFSCARASTSSERTICSDSSLARLDRQLTVLYSRAVDNLSNSSRRALIVAQKQWIQERDQCGSSVGCIARAYTQRIGALR
ncbi:lysozyme inhibitor LprI family protein [Methylorubrum extorquens]|uniref:lysozyme inhibitor LprI family protein n=1 Tax=Methylorubrum extorquens TaxID=408 RepID=UPI0009B656BC|nr:lysozyme inhibitor LprI family protein [Methylorubrum extorquens]